MEQGLNGTEFSRLRQFENQMQVLNFSLRCLNGNEHCLTNANKAIKEQESKQWGLRMTTSKQDQGEEEWTKW